MHRQERDSIGGVLATFLMNQIRTNAAWIWRVITWLFWNPFWAVMVGLPIVILLAGLVWEDWEPRLRMAGLFLQIAGALVTIAGVDSRRKLFHRPGLVKAFGMWCRRFPQRKQNVTVAVGGVGLGTATGTAFATVSAPQDASLQDRVKLLEQGQQQLFLLAHQLQVRIQEERSTRTAELKAERIEREKKDEENLKTIQQATAGGLHVEIIGIAWVVIGLMLATASPELAKWISR